MTHRPPVLPVLFLLGLGPGCLVQAPTSERPSEPIPPPEPSVSVDKEEVEDFDLSADDALAACREIAVEPTVSWSCGPHTVVLARYEDGLPPDRVGSYRGGSPEVETASIPVGDATMEARLLAQPSLDGGPRLLTFLVRDEAGGRVASCAVRVLPDAEASVAKDWCTRALGQVLSKG